MPTFTEERIHIDSSWFSAERDVIRTKGLHLSHVIDFIEAQEGKGRDNKGGLSQAGHAFAASGFLWERILEKVTELTPVELWEWLFSRAMVDPSNPKIIRPGEQMLSAGTCPKCNAQGSAQGIECAFCGGIGELIVYMTPDGYHIETMNLEEWKWTTKSLKGGVQDNPKFKRWIAYQIPCYLKVLKLNTCKLRVNFARGDYTDGVPVWMEYTITYTQQELDEIWDCIANNAQYMVAQGLV